MNRKMILIVMGLVMVFLFAGCVAKPPSSLTLLQMQEDYDYMVRVINEVYPASQVNRQIYNIDTDKALAKYRKRIRGQETPQQFYELISQALYACKGNHLWTSNTLAAQRTRFFFWSWFPDGFYYNDIDNDSIDVTWAYTRASRPVVRSRRGIPLLYYKGDYYTKYPFNIAGRTYDTGMKLLSINNKKVSQIIFSLQDRLDCFDYENRQFYGSMFFPQVGDDFYMLLGDVDLNFEFETTEHQLQSMIVRADDFVEHQLPQIPLVPTRPMIELMAGNGFLYIRLPAMNLEYRDVILNRLEKIEDTTSIRAVLLDVRNNKGGDDRVWIDIISRIMGYEVKLQGKNAYRNTEMVKQCLRMENRIKPTPGEVSFLNDQDFLISSYESTISPSPKSLRLKVPLIIITQDVYSSTGGLLSLARTNDFISRVGISNPTSLGKSGNPWFFSLPNSKIIFSIRPGLDIMSCQTLSDTLHREVDIEINPSLHELLTFYNFSRSHEALEDSLEKADPFFIAVRKAVRVRLPKSEI